ncbi:hypothetical protein BD779DRAFT_1445069 [Infundibulicybe gibba]|nr:hypothetical protein BD779DRAFT_1445069 [Infundibulicybe gibba]
MSFPPSLLHAASAKISEVLENAWAPSTRAKYDNSVTLYLHWCNSEGLPSDKRLPASEITLCAFVAHLAGTMSGSSIRSHLSGLKRWHILANMPYTSSPRLSYLLRGADNMTPGSSRRAPRPPVTLAMIRVLHDSLDLQNSLDACVLATATTAFWAQARLGELLSPSAKYFDPSRIPRLANLDKASTSAGSRKLHLPATKVAGPRGEDIYICKQNGRSDPITALARHISRNSLTADLPLFSYDIGDGRHLALTRTKFLNRCNEIWTRQGWPRLTGHCFRIGGTTELLVAGVPPDVVKAMGRWSSDSFLRYWRSLELIAPKYVERLSKTHTHSLP